jgi:hypothetical protein
MSSQDSDVLYCGQKLSVASRSGVCVFNPGDLEIAAGIGLPVSAAVGLERKTAEIHDAAIRQYCITAGIIAAP